MGYFPLPSLNYVPLHLPGYLGLYYISKVKDITMSRSPSLYHNSLPKVTKPGSLPWQPWPTDHMYWNKLRWLFYPVTCEVSSYYVIASHTWSTNKHGLASRLFYLRSRIPLFGVSHRQNIGTVVLTEHLRNIVRMMRYRPQHLTITNLTPQKYCQPDQVPTTTPDYYQPNTSEILSTWPGTDHNTWLLPT